MTIDSLDWDSAFFGFPAGRLNLQAGVEAEALRGCLLDAPFEFVQIMLDDPRAADIDTISSVADLYDVRTEFSKPITERVDRPSDVVLYDGAASKGLLELAWISGHESRFNRDPRFKPHFKRLYETWLEGSLSGRLADAVFVAERSSQLAGFVTVSGGEVGRIGLIAVHPAFRGAGVGSQLLAAADRWFSQQNISRASVVTQRRNLAARGLYEKYGYHLASGTAVFHYWKKM
jgi:ribosomal protein S18 acetylase RimI-like enzyme